MEQGLARIQLTISKLDEIHELLWIEKQTLKTEVNDLSSNAIMLQQAFEAKRNGAKSREPMADLGFDRPVGSMTMEPAGRAFLSLATCSSLAQTEESPETPGTKRPTYATNRSTEVHSLQKTKSTEFSLSPSKETLHKTLRGLSTDSKLAAPNWMEGNLGLRKKRQCLRQSTLHIELLEQLTIDEKFEKDNPCRGRFRRLAQRVEFDFICGFFITMSAILIGIETQCEATDDDFDSYRAYFLAGQILARWCICLKSLRY